MLHDDGSDVEQYLVFYIRHRVREIEMANIMYGQIQREDTEYLQIERDWIRLRSRTRETGTEIDYTDTMRHKVYLP